ncbi:sodium/glucose cotransporter 4 isoform X2 [Syngnathus scovelli]|uniref:sodium/glucose cotransporter 4 isoform X2 n=1 Tax=Syngnathus scovelli TaxID=161590 RepID=UPI0021102895|nr:sodium/glucose cotransporter 4 isoform X2 [Syngnathus scovelli]
MSRQDEADEAERSTATTCLLTRKASMKANSSTVGGYFLASRSMTWWPIGASLMSSNIGSGAFIGLAGTAAAGGLAVGGFELNAVWVLVALGWIFIPVYAAAGVVTMPEYLAKRFGGRRIQMYMSILSLVLYIFTKLATDFFSGALFIKVSFGWNLYLSTAILLLLSCVYTMAGGLSAVIYTDAFQTVVMVGGAFTLMFIAFSKVGWYEGLMEAYMSSVPAATVINTTCHLPRADAFHMLRDPVSSDLPWPGLIFGLTIIATWVWCTDQVIVQRSLAARSLSHAKGGSVFGAYLKILPLFFIAMPGMISRALFPDEVACVDPAVCLRVCGTPVGCSNIAYPKLVVELMPVGVRGLMLAVIFASLLSSLTSIFNSSATIFTLDLYRQARPVASELELMIVGRQVSLDFALVPCFRVLHCACRPCRVFILLMVVISILWMPIIQSSNSGKLFEYAQSVVSFLAPPITAVFILAIFWPRINEQGAFWGLMAGLVVGLIRMVLEFYHEVPACGQPDPRPSLLTRVHYLYFAIFLMVLSGLVMIAISLATPAIPAEHLHRLTWWSRHSTSPRVDLNAEPTTRERPDPDLAEAPEPPPAPLWRRTVLHLCGMNGATRAVPVACGSKLNSLKEAPLWRNVCNVNALLLLTINVFLWGYYA